MNQDPFDNSELFFLLTPSFSWNSFYKHETDERVIGKKGNNKIAQKEFRMNVNMIKRKGIPLSSDCAIDFVENLKIPKCFLCFESQ